MYLIDFKHFIRFGKAIKVAVTRGLPMVKQSMQQTTSDWYMNNFNVHKEHGQLRHR